MRYITSSIPHTPVSISLTDLILECSHIHAHTHARTLHLRSRSQYFPPEKYNVFEITFKILHDLLYHDGNNGNANAYTFKVHMHSYAALWLESY